MINLMRWTGRLLAYLLRRRKFYIVLLLCWLGVAFAALSLRYLPFALPTGALIMIGLFITQALRYDLDYPVWTNERSIEDRLQYYVVSDQLFLQNVREDSDGFVYNEYGGKLGSQYNPAYIAWYGLVNLTRYIQSGEKDLLKKFLRQLSWLRTRYRDWGSKGYVWTYDFDWLEGKAYLKAPWISAMAQGLAISNLVRGYLLLNDEELLAIARKAIKVFEIAVADGGVMTMEDGHVLYEEYPAYPLARVLDGFLFSLLGLYDLWVVCGDERAKSLFARGVEGLKHNLKTWDFKHLWSWYGRHGYLCPPLYNKLNVSLLLVLYKLTGEDLFLTVARRWDPTSKTWIQKLYLFVALKLTTIKVRAQRLLRNVAYG